MTMRKESLQEFAQLCETFIAEASTSMDLVRSKNGGPQVIKKLHSQGLSHEQSYQPIEKISWSELKGNYNNNWVIIVGDRGVGAIKASERDYEALASSGGDVLSKRDDRGGNILDFLKGNIGGLRKFYVGRGSSDVKDKKKQRADLKKQADATTVTRKDIVKKFKPLWDKALEQAYADVKGMAVTMIKNDAFEKAKKKLSQLDYITNAREHIESGNTDFPEYVESAVQTAISMAAVYHYPELSGEIQTSRYGYRSSGYTTTNDEGPRKLLQDIANGDTAKLGSILAYFKRSLVSG